MERHLSSQKKADLIETHKSKLKKTDEQRADAMEARKRAYESMLEISAERTENSRLREMLREEKVPLLRFCSISR